MDRERKEEQIERLLRRQTPLELSAGFKPAVMRAVGQLPLPLLLSKPRGIAGLWATAQGLGGGEKLGLGLAVLGLTLCFLPGMDGLLSAWQFELADTTLSLSIGELALSASALSLAGLGLGAAFLAVVGAYASKYKLVGA